MKCDHCSRNLILHIKDSNICTTHTHTHTHNIVYDLHYSLVHWFIVFLSYFFIREILRQFLQSCYVDYKCWLLASLKHFYLNDMWVTSLGIDYWPTVHISHHLFFFLFFFLPHFWNFQCGSSNIHSVSLLINSISITLILGYKSSVVLFLKLSSTSSPYCNSQIKSVLSYLTRVRWIICL